MSNGVVPVRTMLNLAMVLLRVPKLALYAP
jgi:hypothetical protein